MVTEVKWKMKNENGIERSAILKGQTLVNLSENIEIITITLNQWYHEFKVIDDIGKLKVTIGVCLSGLLSPLEVFALIIS